VLGKGVARFHLVYWVGMLMSAGIKLPTEEFVHAYITVNGEKMSKSLGNVVNPHDLVATYGTDPVRWYFLSAVSSAQDGDFSESRFKEVYTSELANGIGNLLSRITTMIEKYAKGKAPAPATDFFETERFWKKYHAAFSAYEFDEVARLVQSLVKREDEMISSEKPWDRAKNGEDISVLLYQLAETLRHIGVALLPLMPKSSEKLLESLGNNRDMTWGKLKKGSKITKGEPLFPRLS
jgi:methionyl-tRNA synthetase